MVGIHIKYYLVKMGLSPAKGIFFSIYFNPYNNLDKHVVLNL